MARRKTTNEDTCLDWLDAELKALPDLDIGFDIDLPGLDFDFAELDKLLGFGDLPDLCLDLFAPCAPRKVSSGTAKR